MPFSNFTNPYQNPGDVPQKYRTHPATRKLFRSIVAEAKARVERMILGEEDVA